MNLLYIVLCLIATAINENQARNWPCISTEDCSPITGSSCTDLGLCECLPGFIFSGDFSNCIPEAYYGEDCAENLQCSFPGARCEKNLCTCEEGYQYIRGRCRKFNLLNDPCTEDIDCYFGYDRQSVSCVNRVCSCSEGYYERYNNICRRKSEINGPCVVNGDCENSGSICHDFICVADNSTMSVQTRNVKKMQIEEKRAKTKSTGYNTYGANNKGLGEICSNFQEKCNDLEHSICAGGTCMCQPGYFEHDGLCFAELGEMAMTEDLCEYSFNAENGLCLCPENFFIEPGLRDCRKPIVAEEGRCTSNSQCSPFGASICGEERPRICICEKFAEYDETLQMCVPAKGLGSYCESSDDCYVTNSVCSDDNVCACSEFFIPSNEMCVPGLGGSCRSSGECFTENSFCDEIKNVCTCKEEYVEYQDTCLKKALSVGDPCTSSIQCQLILGELAECMNNTCNCNDNAHINEGVCFSKKTIGESCKSTSECFAPKNQLLLECRNAICECSYGYERDELTNTCEKHGRNSSDQARGTHIIALVICLITSSLLSSYVFRK